MRISKPSFVFGYWRPWKDNANLVDSYLDYTRDISLAKYGADTIGKYINESSKEQVLAIKNLEANIMGGLNIVNQTLTFINRNLDIQIEQQKLSNLLLQNIVELLRVPDSEKERQRSIELGVKFFVNASKDADLYADALEELLKAESLMKQDYFVLHRIGCIYLYVEKYIHPEKALDYFIRAAKYASVESDINAVRLINALTNNFKTTNSKLNSSEQLIGHLAADSYDKAALAAYILGRFDEAVNYQTKALKYNETLEFRFLLAKYQIRNNEIDVAIKNLDICIEKKPVFALAVFKEMEFISELTVLNLIDKKNQKINEKIKTLIEKFKISNSTEENNNVSVLIELLDKPYDIKVIEFEKYVNLDKNIKTKSKELLIQIDQTIETIKLKSFATLNTVEIESIINELKNAKQLPFEKMQQIFNEKIKAISIDELKIGSVYAGGVIFYKDEINNEFLIIKEKPLKGKLPWGGYYNSETYINCSNSLEFGSGELNTKNILENASIMIERGFFSTNKILQQNAATACDKIGWFLPSYDELKKARETLHITGIHKFNVKHLRNSSYKGGFEKFGGMIIDNFIWTSSDINLDGLAYVFSFEIDFHNNKLYNTKRDRTMGKKNEQYVLPIKRIKINK
jgi:tetratricopeptide (TPR) repeat protein